MSKNILDIDSNMAIKDPQLKGISWYSPLNKGMFASYGSNAFDEGNYFRLSNTMREAIYPISDAVWYLATNPAGIQLKFQTNSRRILLDVSLRDIHNMPHMPATGQCGFDLYVFDSDMNQYVHHSTSVYDLRSNCFKVDMSHFYEVNDEKVMRKYILNFPLYQGVKELKIGLESDSITLPDYFDNNGKIVIYGTSITQGGCVSRPGLLYTNILSRLLDIEVVNQGYSGSAMLEPIMGDFIGQIKEQKLFVIDAEANAGCDFNYLMEKNLESFINEYKKHQPSTPILLVSRSLFSMDRYDNERVNLKKYYREFMFKLIDKYQKAGQAIYFLDGDKFFDGFMLNFTEFTVDGLHPTDFGNYLIAKAHYDKIKDIIKFND